MELLDLITNKTKCKVFHLEIYENNRLYIGAGIKANTLEEAEIIMRGCFLEGLTNDADIVCINEDWIH